MIREMKPLTLIEAKSIAEAHGAEIEELKPYFKKFVKLKEKDVKEMRKELEALENHKIREEHIVKIIDFLPEDASEINKIFTDIGLEENEINQIRDVVKKFK